MNILKTYDYQDKTGSISYRRCRLKPTEKEEKPFVFQRPDGAGGWITGLGDIKQILYHLPELLAASMQDWIFVAEGEKDTDKLAELGFEVTTSGSSTSWKPEFGKYFTGRHVVILPDFDEPGQRYAETVAKSIHAYAGDVRIVNLPGLSMGGDVSDWLDAVGTKKKLIKLVDQAEPYKPPQKTNLSYQLLSKVSPTAIEYLQPEIVPMGMLTNVISLEGTGKSVLASDIMARVTTGRPWPNAPDVPNKKGFVIVFNHEEDVPRVLVPRLIAAGADTSKIVEAMDVVTAADGKENPFDIEHDIEALDGLIDDYPETRLIIFDPITSYCSCNENSNAEVRRALKPLVDLAMRRNVAILCLTHLNKKVDLGMINRTIGSRAWCAVPRMVWGIRTEVIEDAEGQKIETETRFLLNVKCNIGRKPQGLKFTIQDGGRIEWDGERVDLSMDSEAKLKGCRSYPAEEWLKKFLSNGCMSSTTVFTEAEGAGFSRGQMYTAKDRLKINPSKYGFGNNGEWSWQLPQEQNDG